MNTTKWQKNIDEIIVQKGKTRVALLPCLEASQESDGYISPTAVSYLRDALDIPSADIYSVISFYSMLSTAKQGKYVIRLCNSLPCYINYSGNILAAIEEYLGIKAGQTTADNKFTLELVGCLGLCDQAPAIMINDKCYGNLTSAKVKQIISELK